MKLRSIKIHGFKSFADKIELDFKSNIIAIVGPNGSGKSNIVDAIRWVLGEQSIKSLRGSKEMIDVIFAGSESRNPLKRAEVSLDFDNTDHYLNSDLVDVEVKRILYHTGESEYFINNAKVRLKDITNLFLDSGIGNDSLNIISQGSIESIVNSKPIDRRVILEGASKVLKYKTRKIESIRKLEKTNDNLEKVQLVIDELNVSLEPLKKQSEDARKYLELESELKKVEISLTTYDIAKNHELYNELESKRKTLEEKKLELETNSNKENNDIESLKIQSLELDDEINELNEKVNSLTKELLKLENQRTLLLERQKYSIDSEKLDLDFVNMKEQELKITKEIEVLEYELKDLRVTKLEKEKEKESNNITYSNLLSKKSKNDELYENLIRKEVSLQNQIEILKNNIRDDTLVPTSVKSVLHNPRLKGIHGTIESLINVEEKYATAINVALSSSSNFVVVDNGNVAKIAITYLKENHLGRVTFFPLDVILSRLVSSYVIERVKNIKGFIGIASEIITYDNKYKNIIENQLGNVFITKDMNSMEALAKMLDYKYRVVTLDGEITHAGGSLTGGTLRKKESSILEKIELAKKESELKNVIIEKQNALLELKNVEKEINEYERRKEKETDILFTINRNVEIKEKGLFELKSNLENLRLSIERASSYKEGSLDNEVAKLLEQESDIGIKKEVALKKLNKKRTLKSEISSKINEEEYSLRKKNSEVHGVEQELNEILIKKNKIDVKMDYLLELLSDTYHMTYEKAKEEYVLDIDEIQARERVSLLKKQMQSFGNVNLGSIEEYDRIKTRYDFLYEQKQDLTLSISELESIITEMDALMVERLTTTFEKIEKEFSIVFQKLFKGGRGMLKLTDPDNILETGIEIIAEPPGKKLNNIALLSGGEKTLTAIALLFAILNVFPVPFCVLDEVEAALDEANVDTFGNYLQSQKDKSEYILITHKKRTMEYADTLYGITMQEQGVSKIVSVKLEDKE